MSLQVSDLIDSAEFYLRLSLSRTLHYQNVLLYFRSTKIIFSLDKQLMKAIIEKLLKLLWNGFATEIRTRTNNTEDTISVLSLLKSSITSQFLTWFSFSNAWWTEMWWCILEILLRVLSGRKMSENDRKRSPNHWSDFGEPSAKVWDLLAPHHH